MLQKFKEFLTSTGEQIQSLTEGSNTTVIPKSAEEKIIDNFETYIFELESNTDSPKKMVQNLKDILVLVKDIKFNDMELEDQSLVRRILESDTKIMVDVYFSLPKAHAVSVVLENGKTAKETLIENTRNLYNKINQIWIDSVNKKTEALLKKQKVAQKMERKKDFFDL